MYVIENGVLAREKSARALAFENEVIGIRFAAKKMQNSPGNFVPGGQGCNGA